MITPENFKLDDEESHQKCLMCWAALNFNIYPELKWLHHSPNGGFRNKREAAKLKAMGVKRGFPDLELLVKRKNFGGLLIELKHPREKHKTSVDPSKNGASKEQIEWGDHLRVNGFGYKLCHGWIEARDILISYLEWK